MMNFLWQFPCPHCGSVYSIQIDEQHRECSQCACVWQQSTWRDKIGWQQVHQQYQHIDLKK